MCGDKTTKKYCKPQKACKVEKVCKPQKKIIDCNLDDKLKKEIFALWKCAFPDAIVEVDENQILQIAHKNGLGVLPTLNGIPSKSSLVTSGFYSVECADHHWVNLYEIGLPDIDGLHGDPSTTEIYVDTLNRYGLSVDADNYNWKGEVKLFEQALPAYIHHKGIDIHPLIFTRITILALKTALKEIKSRSKLQPPQEAQAAFH